MGLFGEREIALEEYGGSVYCSVDPDRLKLIKKEGTSLCHIPYLMSLLSWKKKRE